MFEESGTRSWEAVLEGPYCREPLKRNEATTYGTNNEPQGVCEDTQEVRKQAGAGSHS